jgi:hypothetical protein
VIAGQLAEVDGSCVTVRSTDDFAGRSFTNSTADLGRDFVHRSERDAVAMREGRSLIHEPLGEAEFISRAESMI